MSRLGAREVTIGSLFSGIGGLERGLEQAGLGPVVWQAEIDISARRVLAQHWPDARRFEDVHEVCRETASWVDVICGGFPCQDLSSANVVSRQGLAGSQSGLWREFARIVGDIRPRWVVVENVAKDRIWERWVPFVRRDLHRIGYASVPVAVSAAEVGAPHHRDRVFVVAHANGEGQCVCAVDATLASLPAVARRLRPDFWGGRTAALARADGLPARLARLPGNAVVVGVAYAIGLGIAEVTRTT